MPIHIRDWYRKEYERIRRELNRAPGEVLDPREVRKAQEEATQLRKMLDKHFPDEKKRIGRGKVALIVTGCLFLLSGLAILLVAGQVTTFVIQATIGGVLLVIGIKKR